MGRFTFVLTLLSTLCVCGGSAQDVGPSAANRSMVIGYYADWTAEKYPLADIPATKLTHVNYAFGKIGPDNRLIFNSGPAVDRVYPGDCTEPGCPHGLFHQIADQFPQALKRELLAQPPSQAFQTNLPAPTHQISLLERHHK